MNTKLTLNMDRIIIEKAKMYARVQRKSLSKIVGEYLRSLSSEKTKNNNLNKQLAPITNELIGMIRIKQGSNEKYDEILSKALLEDYE
jgi:hypothetical protein